jgi:threonine dehydrogenase-like Zn-dependent dehydrogenase
MVLSSVAGAPLSVQETQSHFDTAFLDKFPTADINAVFARFPVPGRLAGVVSSGPIGLVVIANFGIAKWKVTLSVDPSGLIQLLDFTPSASASQ